MRKIPVLLPVALSLVSLTACADHAEDSPSVSQTQSEQEASASLEKPLEGNLQMRIADTAVRVEWEDNEAVSALRELVKDEPLTVQMSMYGGFEQVGPLGRSLPANDTQIMTEAGDIVLYSGDQIVVFYGSNSWAYTRLGHIMDKTTDEMKTLLGNGDVTITVSQGD